LKAKYSPAEPGALIVITFATDYRQVSCVFMTRYLQKSIKMAALELWLDDYNDIYSDFDSRHYSKRRISEDFIAELQLAFANKGGFVQDVLLLLPQEKRNKQVEPIVAESLHSLFDKRRMNQYFAARKKRNGALLLVFAGIIVMMIGALITYRITDTMLSHFLRILIEPAGWFMLWTGLDRLIYDLKKLRKEATFYRELAGVKWHFQSTSDS
jgi:hypothetical protein